MPTPVVLYLNCARCLSQRQPSVSPIDHARLQVGLTSDGDIVVECSRHGMEVATFHTGVWGQEVAAVLGHGCYHHPRVERMDDKWMPVRPNGSEEE